MKMESVVIWTIFLSSMVLYSSRKNEGNTVIILQRFKLIIARDSSDLRRIVSVRYFVLESINPLRKYSAFVDSIFVRSNIICAADWSNRRTIQVNDLHFSILNRVIFPIFLIRELWLPTLVNTCGFAACTSFFRDIFLSTRLHLWIVFTSQL